MRDIKSILNKKQLSIVSTLILLMLFLTISQKFFNKNFQRIILDDNGISSFEKYNFNKSRCNILLPNEWNIYSINENNNDMLNIVYFTDSNNNLNGSLEVLSTNEEMRKFALRDCKNQLLKYDTLKVLPYNNKNNSGILLTYNTTIKDGNNYKNKCYYVKMKDGKLIKVLFNVKDKCYRENIDTVFNSIVSSIELN